MSKMGLAGLKSSCQQGWFLLKTRGMCFPASPHFYVLHSWPHIAPISASAIAFPLVLTFTPPSFTLKDPCGHIHCGHIELTEIIKEKLLVSRSLIYLIVYHGRRHIHRPGDDYVDIFQGERAFFSSPQASAEEHLLQCHNRSPSVSI